MNATTFLLLATVVLILSLLAGLSGQKPAKDEPALKDEIHRWAVFRIHLDRLLGGEGPIVESLPGGPLLISKGSPSEKRLCLADRDGKPRVLIRIRRFFSRHIVKVRMDGRPLAELRSRKGEGMGELRSREVDFDIAGDTQALELELRRSGKLLASVSAEIAASPGSVGVEILSAEDPMPVLAVVTALGFLRELSARTAAAETC